MGFTNSPLVSYTRISPNKTANRKHPIDTVTIHCVVGQCSVETLGSVFAPESIQASANYGIGPDGRIGMYVEEKDRSWCSSNAANDHRAVTIEVASDTEHPYAVNANAYAGLLDLVTDICKRNGIGRLVWSTDKNERINHLNGCNMTVHRDYANKACPGDYLYNRHGEIAAEVNRRLGSTDAPAPQPADSEPTIQESAPVKAELYRVRKSWSDAKSQIGAYKILANAKRRADENEGYTVYDSAGNAVYPIEEDSVAPVPVENAVPYRVQVTTDYLNIRPGPGTNYPATGRFTGRGIFTIVEEADGEGASRWGKLKSGAGWISLDYATRI